MRFKRLLWRSGLLTGFSISALAATLPDPGILLDVGSASSPITTGINTVQPNGANTLIFDFFNNTGSVITGFTFQTTVTAGLQGGPYFSCQDRAGFFLNCAAGYTAATGSLIISFSGVKPDDLGGGLDTGAGQQEGIPPLMPQCAPNPDAPGCQVGHFYFTLEGWTLGADTPRSVDGVPLYSPEGLVLDNHFTTDAVPEPSGVVLFGTGLLLVLALGARRAARRRTPAISCAARAASWPTPL